MRAKSRQTRGKCLKQVIFALAAMHSRTAPAASPALSSLGQSGGLVIPYASLLPSGQAEFQFNNFKDPRFASEASDTQSYLGAIGLFPYVELSGGLVNYSQPGINPTPGEESFLFRHLFGNVKLGIPHLLDDQPDIAIGATDFGGQTHYFRSKYVVASQTFGPATFALGAGNGQRLNGVFGGAELSLWHTGLSVLAEDDSKVAYAGIRYRSPAIPWLWNAQILGTAQRALNARPGDVAFNRTSVSVGVQIPLSKDFDSAYSTTQASPSIAPMPHSGEQRTTDTPTLDATLASGLGPAQTPSAEPRATVAVAAAGRPGNSTINPVRQQAAVVTPLALMSDTERLSAIRRKLVELGLERVRVGRHNRYLVVEYENHRYNQNEADALGIVLGVAASLAPQDVVRVVAIIEKAGMSLGQVSVDRMSFASFISGGHDDRDVGDTMLMSTRPTFDESQVAWQDDRPTRHGLARIEIEPATNYLIGTEYGKFDYSLAANIEGFVPLWKGAELYTSYLAPVSNSANVGRGRVFSSFRLEGGLSDVALNQIWWASDQTLNVVSVGKFYFHYLGVEDETTFFVPSRPDIVRLRLAYLRGDQDDQKIGLVENEANAVLLYRWVQPSWNMWLEFGAARYVGGDRGPLVNLVRWFGDVSVTLSASHSGFGTFAGVSVSFPLTPRQGMRPGIVQLSGSESFPLSVQTRVGAAANNINQNAVENLSFGYSTQQFLLNQGRFSEDYFQSQLYRMRDAYWRYAISPAATD